MIEHEKTWMGRNIEELSKEELMEALKVAAKLYHDALQSNIKSHQFIRALREAA